MPNFTLKQYKQLLLILKERHYLFLTFREYVSSDLMSERVCLIRHDVDRKPSHALAMAQIEATLNVRATYYFRTKSCSFVPPIITSIAALGHEIGYHYESLSDAAGDIKKAFLLFKKSLDKLRQIVPVYTVSMHGRPLSPYDNRTMWQNVENRRVLHKNYGILAEIMLDIDYSNIAYINDTGRNWSQAGLNIRDMVESEIDPGLKTTADVFEFFCNTDSPVICFQIHPERWTDFGYKWIIQFFTDLFYNTIKRFIRLTHRIFHS